MAARYQPCKARRFGVGHTAHSYVEAGRSGIFIMMSSAPSLYR